MLTRYATGLCSQHENSTGESKIERAGLPDPERHDHQLPLSARGQAQCPTTGAGHGNKPHPPLGGGKPAYSKGLLLSVPNRGVFAAEITPAAALEIYTVRASLEGMAAKLAAGNIRPEAVARMERILARQ
jgi:hypothetical protein